MPFSYTSYPFDPPLLSSPIVLEAALYFHMLITGYQLLMPKDNKAFPLSIPEQSDACE